MSGIGYAGIFVLDIVLCVAFSVILYVDVRRVQRTAERAQEKANIICDLIALDAEIRSSNMRKNAYLMQIDNFLQGDPFEIDRKKIAVCKPQSDNKADQKIYRIYRNAPATVRTYMETLSGILGRIYELNHPLKFKMLELKKNIKLHFLLFFLKFFCFLIKFLDKCDDNKNKKSLKKLKSQQKKIEKYPRSILLNGTNPEPMPAAA